MNSTLNENIFKSIWNLSAKSIYLLNNLSLALKITPNVGLEPTTVGLRVQRSTD